MVYMANRLTSDRLSCILAACCDLRAGADLGQLPHWKACIGRRGSCHRAFELLCFAVVVLIAARDTLGMMSFSAGRAGPRRCFGDSKGTNRLVVITCWWPLSQCTNVFQPKNPPVNGSHLI